MSNAQELVNFFRLHYQRQAQQTLQHVQALITKRAPLGDVYDKSVTYDKLSQSFDAIDRPSHEKLAAILAKFLTNELKPEDLGGLQLPDEDVVGDDSPLPADEVTPDPK